MLTGTAEAGMATCELGSFAVSEDVRGPVEVVVRPESIAIGHAGRRDADAEGVVVARSFYGHDQVVSIQLPSGSRLRSRGLGFPAWHPGDRVRLWVEGPVSALGVAQRREPVGTAR